ncbi:cyclic AMP response element-binding protein B-like [Anopheles cruzii]|uniref:cyclic AMP response element-binding protein B-like n=1 Tax=Anopheles cruzii TaxID=68878 RepID=UPI0022EC54D1|nr:cyclic AMP response element-binding protein B-like [Anopheles cruzii]
MRPLSRSVQLLCNKPNTVIHTTTGNLYAMDIKPEPNTGSGSVAIKTETNSDGTLSDEKKSPKKRSDLLTRQPSHIMGGKDHDQLRNREMRLAKNREVARQCRHKKKEYIKHIENRVALLENQNKALVEELKELYRQQNSDRVVQNTASGRLTDRLE